MCVLGIVTFLCCHTKQSVVALDRTKNLRNDIHLHLRCDTVLSEKLHTKNTLYGHSFIIPVSFN
jgi:hypothetical protein